MTDTKWEIRGREFVHCNCDYSCPCQFNARPTYGDCRAVVGIEIDEGRHGDTPLDGMRLAVVMGWPGAIHEGNGEVLPIVDKRATPEQREALLRILSGEDTEPGATIFQVFSTTWGKVHEPVSADIEFEVDVEGRRAKLGVPDLIEARGEPILNPVTGKEHRARIDLPHGFEYTLAEVGRGWTRTSGPIVHDLQDSHAHFAPLHMTGSGVVR
jgi:hypothetical protein